MSPRKALISMTARRWAVLAAIIGCAGIGPRSMATEPSGPLLVPKRSVAVDEEFMLGRAEAAHVDELDILVRVTELRDVRCPPGARCPVSDGPFVRFDVLDARTYQLIHMGGNLAAPSHFPWFVRDVASDGRTFVRLVVHRTVDWCTRQGAGHGASDCWQRTADLSHDAGHCNHIEDVSQRSECVRGVARLTRDAAWCGSSPQRDACVESIASEFGQSELCSKVARPRGYCITSAVSASGEIERCPRIRSARADCYEAAALHANSTEVCTRLADPFRTECRNVLRDRLGARLQVRPASRSTIHPWARLS